MPCYHPLTGYRYEDGSVRFVERQGAAGVVTVGCGNCVGCRDERARQWAVRCMHEASLHEENCAITLTYAPEHLPVNGSLEYRDFQLFMKRLRKRAGVPVRFFMCGEYGSEKDRPHFHALLFGFRFCDGVSFSTAGERCRWLYTSPTLSGLWKFGHSTFGEMSFASAAYIARYVLKKVNGDAQVEHYRRVNVETGEVYDLEPEFCSMSLRPGIGGNWLRLFWPEVLQRGTCVVQGHEGPAPRFYMSRLRKLDGFAEVERQRYLRSLETAPDRTPERLAVAKEVHKARLRSFKRKLT